MPAVEIPPPWLAVYIAATLVWMMSSEPAPRSSSPNPPVALLPSGSAIGTAYTCGTAGIATAASAAIATGTAETAIAAVAAVAAMAAGTALTVAAIATVATDAPFSVGTAVATVAAITSSAAGDRSGHRRHHLQRRHCHRDR